MEHRPLYYREKLLGYDVAMALTNLVGLETLPTAVTKEEVAVELVNISCLDEDGVAHVLPAGAKMSLMRDYLTTLMTSKVFQSGYEQFSKALDVPVVPVTAYFFNHVYDQNVRDLLDAMTETDLVQSLPKRTTMIEVGDESVPSGKVAGIVVFPQGSKKASNNTLLARWLQRRGNVAAGQIQSATRMLEQVAPDHPRLPDLQRAVGVATKTMRLVAPKVRASDDEIFN